MAHPLRVPTPKLRIIPVEHLFPHEEHDWQRSQPLIERLRHATTLTNPPIVAPINDQDYVVLDGANRYHSLCHLEYVQILCQVVDYQSEYVDLVTWHHVLTDTEFKHVTALVSAHTTSGVEVAHITSRDGQTLVLSTSDNSLTNRNKLLCTFTSNYLKFSAVHRTTLNHGEELWSLFPTGCALIQFTPYTPDEIMRSASKRALLPPGVSRHIIQGRALQLEYPLNIILDTIQPLDEKNHDLNQWIIQKMSQRAVRFYGESVYQFNE